VKTGRSIDLSQTTFDLEFLLRRSLLSDQSRAPLVWIPALFGSTPSNICLCGSLQTGGSTPLCQCALFSFWINPSHRCLCGSLQLVDQPLSSWLCGLPLVVDQPLSSLTVWIARTCGSSPRLRVWIASRCGSTPHIYCLCGSPLTVDNSLVSPSIRIPLWLSILHSNLSLRLPWFSLRNGECNEAVAPSTAPFSSD